MKASKDKDGKVTWAHEDEREKAPFSGTPVEKLVPKPGLMEKMKEKAQALSQEEESEGL